MPGFQGYHLNHPSQDRWCLEVGKLVLNFAGIEIQTYEWLRKLTDAGTALDESIEKLFAGRVRLVKKVLTEISIPEPLRQSSLEAWEEAEELAKVRNIFVHSPVVYAWYNREAIGEPDEMVVLDYKSASGFRRTVMGSVGLEGVSKMVNEAYRVAGSCSRVGIARFGQGV